MYVSETQHFVQENFDTYILSFWCCRFPIVTFCEPYGEIVLKSTLIKEITQAACFLLCLPVYVLDRRLEYKPFGLTELYRPLVEVFKINPCSAT